MKRLSKLKNLNRYLKTFAIPEHPDIRPIRIVDQGDATSRLSKASGDQVLIALPECNQSGSTDQWREQISFAFFIIARVNNQMRNPEVEDESYSRLLDIADILLERLCDDMEDRPCGFLGGLELSDINIIPEYSIFGGWSGYSIEIVF